MLNLSLGLLISLVPLLYRNLYPLDFSFGSSYCWGNERVDELIVQSVETPFIEERLSLIEEGMDIVVEEAPAVLAVFNPHLVALRDYVSGCRYQVHHVAAGGYFYDVSKGGQINNKI